MPSIPTEKIMQERLELEYCPPLDSVLIAALVADLYMEPPTDTKIAELRRTLDLLATQADSDERAAAAGEVPTTTTDDDATTASDGTSSPWRSADGRSTTLATTVNGSPKSASAASDAGTSTDSFSSPLGFLSTAFPHISYERLSRALSDAAGAADPAQGEIDIVAVIEDVLTKEYLAELDDRGIEAGAAGAPPPPKPWVSVVPKKKKGKAKARAVAINDVRQQHHILPRSAHPMTAGAAALDAWTAVASLSARMAALLPPHPDTHFASFFHSPSHHSPAAAARAALRSLPSQPLPLDTLVTLREILAYAPELDALDAEARAQTLETDAGLCARATGGERLDDAIQLVWFLRELDDDHAGGWAFGPYHTGDGDSKPVHTSTRQMQARLPAHPPDVAPPPVPPKMMRRATAPAQAQTDAWSTVPLKPRAKPSAHAAFIPAYTRQTTTSASTSAPKKSSWAPAVSARPPTTLDELRRLRTEAIVNAGRAWQKGNARNRGGEVALFYAEQARELGERVRGAALEDARARVANARTEGAIDLHFLTVAEAVAVAREAVEEMEGREGEGKTLRIVTGRGRHSREGRSVLLPAVRTALVEDGWNVSSFDAGLIVRGRR